MNLIYSEPHAVEVVEIVHWGIDGSIIQELFDCGHSITYGLGWPQASPAFCEQYGYAPDSPTRRCWGCACTIEPERTVKARRKIVSVKVIEPERDRRFVRQLELWA